jgi:cell division protein ZapE
MFARKAYPRLKRLPRLRKWWLSGRFKLQSLLARYEALVAAAELRPDPDQAKIAARLDRLAHELADRPERGSILWRMLRKAPPVPRGVYLWGGVGRGKSMLMDLFFNAVSIMAKRRVHFHEYMLEVHDRLHAERVRQKGDPLLAVAQRYADELRLLAFDEMVINNSADAMLMSRLFTALIDAGVVIVTTSNRPPHELYNEGLNREHFLPFIALIEARLDIMPLDGPTDYRLERIGGQPVWYSPFGEAATDAARAMFFRLTDYPPEDRAHVPSEELIIAGGRTLLVPKSLKGVAVFSFKKLCGEARGAPDYLAIARRFHSVILVGIPVMGPEMRNEAARFKVLIDALYEHKVKLIALADAPPDQLYRNGDGQFEFERTVSRLIEMQSQDYLAAGHGGQ